MTRRWRFASAMLGMGAGLALVTLPVVGVHSWLEWLQVGRIASELYNRDQNWIFLSRDLLGLPAASCSTSRATARNGWPTAWRPH